MTEGKELTNQEKIRMRWEKESYKYMGIVEANNIKLVDMKEKIKFISRERGIYLKQYYISRISSKG